MDRMRDMALTVFRMGREMRAAANNFSRNRWQFLRAFLLVFFVTLSVFTVIGLVPEKGGESSAPKAENGVAIRAVSVEDVSGALPVRVVAPSVGIDTNVSSPQSRDVMVLDAALAGGAVHYPGSGSLTEDANVFIFGHSSYLPVVRNKAYQAFNGIGDLVPGDDIFVDSEHVRYSYRVSSVRKATAEEALVAFVRGERKLTLSTCDSFGSKAGRFVVEAVFSGTRPL